MVRTFQISHMACRNICMRIYSKIEVGQCSEMQLTPFNSDNKNGRKGDALTNESILRRKIHLQRKQNLGKDLLIV